MVRSGVSAGLMAAANAAAAGGAHRLAFDRRFVEALGKSIGVIGASEIGDKTFFIAAIMAMRHPRLTVRRGGRTGLRLEPR
jgi:phosphoglycerate dehydrogenase-like enzyme